MNERVKTRMFTIPVTVYPVASFDSMGDVVESAPINLKCYRADETQIVVTTEGEEERSNIQLYMNGTDALSIFTDDLISIDGADKVRIIKKQVFYLPGGVADIGVFYLP